MPCSVAKHLQYGLLRMFRIIRHLLYGCHVVLMFRIIQHLKCPCRGAVSYSLPNAQKACADALVLQTLKGFGKTPPELPQQNVADCGVAMLHGRTNKL